MFGIDQRQDGVQQVLLGDFLVHEKGLRHRAGIGQPGGFNDHALEVQQALALLGGQQLQGLAQVLADRAADAAVVHLDDVFLGVVDQDLVVDVFLAELVLDHGDFLAVGFGQDALEQCGFAGAEEAGQDGHGNQTHGVCLKNTGKTGEKRERWTRGGGEFSRQRKALRRTLAPHGACRTTLQALSSVPASVILFCSFIDSYL